MRAMLVLACVLGVVRNALLPVPVPVFRPFRLPYTLVDSNQARELYLSGQVLVVDARAQRIPPIREAALPGDRLDKARTLLVVGHRSTAMRLAAGGSPVFFLGGAWSEP